MEISVENRQFFPPLMYL